jgi:hypothetical protein
MQTALVVAIAVVVLIAIGVAVYYALTAQRSRRLRDRFGPEYDRTVSSTGDQRAAERELAAREAERKHLEIRDLDPEARAKYAERWVVVQGRFVDVPAEALRDADALVTELMSQMGYPMDGFERMAANVSVDHPQEVEDYRAAHAASMASDASTEDMRRGIQRYRSLFQSLLGREVTTQGADRASDGSEPRDPSRADRG